MVTLEVFDEGTYQGYFKTEIFLIKTFLEHLDTSSTKS